MPYKIPDDDVLSSAISSAADRKSRMESQRELVELVRKELLKKDPDYRAGAERIRRLTVEKSIMRVEIDYRDSPDHELPGICPVCRNALDAVRNMSLDGEIVEVKRKCPVCSYGIGRDSVAPGRYVFVRIGRKEVPEDVQRIRKLKKARAKLNEASALIESALRMTGMESRGEYAKDMLAHIAESKEEAGSITNIIADLDARNRGLPGWSRPGVSVKNENLKNI